MKKELIKLNKCGKKYNMKTLGCRCSCYCNHRDYKQVFDGFYYQSYHYRRAPIEP